MREGHAWWRYAVRALLWGAAYYGLGRLGLLTTVDDVPLALVAPSTGLGIVWFSLATRRSLPYDALALYVAGVLLSWELGLPTWLALVGPSVTLVQFGLFVAIMRRWAPDLVPFGTGRTVWRLRDLGGFIAAGAVATVLAAAVNTGLQHVAGLPAGDLTAFLVRWGRNAATITSVGGLGLISIATLQPLVSRRGLRGLVSASVQVPRTRLAEGIALVVTSALAYYLVFDVLEAYPVTYLLIIVTAWAGARFTPMGGAVHSLAIGSVAVVYTLAGNGRFNVVDDPLVVALIAQSFVHVMAATALSLSISRAELADSELLSEQRARLLDDVLTDVADGVLVLDAEGQYVFANRAAVDLVGVSGRTMLSFDDDRPYALHRTGGEEVPLHESPFARALTGEKLDHEEFELRWKDGRPPRVVRLNAHLMPSRRARDGGLVLINFHDVTADRLREEALVSFAGHVAHDLQNPLTIVQTWTEILHDSFEGGKAVDADEGLLITSKVLKGSARMKDFIRELLDYTVARDQALRPVELDVVAVAEDVASMRRSETSRSPVEITVVGAGTAWADPVLTRVVIDNLVSNAIKYVAPGVAPRITVALHQVEPEWVEVAVIDNGIGIAEDQRQKIFDSFVRLEAGTYEGTGLGLGICHKIVTRHGGVMAVRQVETGGSRVSFTLPTRLLAESSDREDQRTQR